MQRFHLYDNESALIRNLQTVMMAKYEAKNIVCCETNFWISDD